MLCVKALNFEIKIFKSYGIKAGKQANNKKVKKPNKQEKRV